MKLYDILMNGNPAENFRDMDRDTMLKEFPEVWRLRGCLELEKWHPEGNTFEHTMLVLNRTFDAHGSHFQYLFNALVHDFGKTKTPLDKMPKFHGHALAGVDMVHRFGNKHGVHQHYIDIAKFVTKYHMHLHDVKILRPITFERMFKEADSHNEDNGYEKIMALYYLGVADVRGRLGHDQDDVSHLHILLDNYQDWKIKGNIFRA